MANILTDIKSIVENSSLNIAEKSDEIIHNRANHMGAALEDYVKNAFANCLGQSEREIKHARSQAFSYLGNSKNPPDAMLKGGDAVEIKKMESLINSQLQLNSSYPKNKLYSGNPKICNNCRTCEEWDEKDMLYVVGQVKEQELHNLFFIYGDLYCDSHEVYEDVENVIKEGLQSLEEVELAETNELGRVNKVDHLGISDLRIRGMWLIKSPFLQFGYLTEDTNEYTFKLVALIPESKYSNFENVNEFEKFCKDNGVSISDEEIENPQNPANLINTKLIIYHY